MPFKGHLRVAVRSGWAGLAVAGRVAGDCSVEEAYAVARRMEGLLGAAVAGAGDQPDRHAVLRKVWELVAGLPAASFGSGEGADLTLLVVAYDADGVGVAGVGLAALWGERIGEPGLVPVVPDNHPLLTPQGRPDGVPGVLTLEKPYTRLVGSPAHQDPVAPAIADVSRRCGVRT